MRDVLVEGHTVADTIRRANAGQLGMPAFDIGRYAYQLVRDGRDQYEAEHEDALHRGIDDELKALEIAALSHARAIRRRFKGDGSDSPEALAKAAQALSATKKARRDANTAKNAAKPKATPVQTGANTKAADVLGDLLAKTGTVRSNGGAGPVASVAR